MCLLIKLLILGTLLELFFLNIEAKKYGIPCLDAAVCLHRRRRRVCGLERETNEVRWFLDKCDLLEFNCQYKAKFRKARRRHCRQIPPL